MRLRQGGSAECAVTPELDHERESESLRSELTTGQRTAKMRFAIDPGFVHHSRVEAVVAQPGMDLINREIQALPDLPEWMRHVRVDHIYTRALVAFCEAIGV